MYMCMFVFPMQQSGLSDWLGSQLTVLGSLPHPVIGLLVSVMVASTTEVMSNIATTTLFLPVLRNLVSTMYNVSLVYTTVLAQFLVLSPAVQCWVLKF